MRRKIPQLPLDVLLVIWSFCNSVTKYRMAFITKKLCNHQTFIQFKADNRVINQGDFFKSSSKRVKSIVNMIENMITDRDRQYLRIGELEAINLEHRHCGRHALIYSGHSFKYPNLAPRSWRGANDPFGHLVSIIPKDKKENKTIRLRLKKLKIGYARRGNNIIVIMDTWAARFHDDLQSILRHFFMHLGVI